MTTTWRMAFREGNQGQDKWEDCRKCGVAAYTYPGIGKTDLSHYNSEEELYAFLSKFGLASNPKANIRKLVFDVREGDVIYVKEGPSIVGRGVVVGRYQFDPSGQINSGDLWWSHQVPVKWDARFKPIQIVLGSEQTAILELLGPRLKQLTAEISRSGQSTSW
jgi:hypothetical protein